MALVVLPEGTQISGSIGGTVYSRNRFGAYKRSRSVPVNPNTDRQVAVRNSVRSLTIAWQNELTTILRAAWEVYASNIVWKNKLGQDVVLTGLNHYVRSNTPRLLASLARLDVAPTIFNLGVAELGLAAAASAATQEVSMTFLDTQAWADEDGAFEAPSLGLPQNASVAFFGGPYRLTDPVLGSSTTPPTSPVVLDSPFVFAEGQRLWLRTRIGRADGRLSEFARVNFLAEA